MTAQTFTILQIEKIPPDQVLSDHFSFQYRTEIMYSQEMGFFITISTIFREIIHFKCFRHIPNEFMLKTMTCHCFGTECRAKRPQLLEVVLYIGYTTCK